MSNVIPEKLINFKVYLEGYDMLGIADVTLPKFEAMTETIKGAGIAGEIDSPTPGHFGSMTLGLNWRTITAQNAGTLLKPKAHSFDLRGAFQNYVASAGEYLPTPVKISVKGTTKNVDLGKFEVGAMTGTSTEFEVSYIKITVNGIAVVELDKFNDIYKVDGTDYLLPVRIALGLL